MSPIVTVFGATGKQGSSVVRALLADGGFHVRGVTRNPNSSAAKALKSQGVEVVEGNLLIKETVEKAIAGSTIVFGVTNFWDADNFNPDKVNQLRSGSASAEEPSEVTQGRNLVEASKTAGIKFFVWSSLPSVTDTSKAAHQTNPKLKVYTHVEHYDQKAVTDKLLATSGLNYAIIHTGYFLENLTSPGWGPQKGADGVYTIIAQNFKAEGVAEPEQDITWVARDLGPSVLALIKNYETRGSEILGKTFRVVSMRASYQRIARALHESTGKEFRFDADAKATQEVEDMFEYQASIGAFRGQEIPDPRLVSLGVKFATVEEFAADKDVKAFFA